MSAFSTASCRACGGIRVQPLALNSVSIFFFLRTSYRMLLGLFITSLLRSPLRQRGRTCQCVCMCVWRERTFSNSLSFRIRAAMRERINSQIPPKEKTAAAAASACRGASTFDFDGVRTPRARIQEETSGEMTTITARKGRWRKGRLTRGACTTNFA